ncbi:MAG: hypothetical protein H7836_16040 [Magnetococcus sp. YQC-3]
MMNSKINVSHQEATCILDHLAPLKEPPLCLLGNALRVMKSSGMFRTSKCYISWLRSEYKLGKRMAYNYMEFAEKIDEIGSPIDKVMASGLESTHLMLLTPMINAENLDYWLGRAKQLTAVGLKKELKAAKMAKTT